MSDQSVSLASRKAPAMPDIGVVAFVPDEWGGLWYSRHQVLTRLAKYFHVAWVDQPRGLREHWLPGQSANDPCLNHAVCPPGFIRYQSGRWLPNLARPASLGDWLAAHRARAATALLRRQGCGKTVFYLWRPQFANVLDGATCDLSCYHIVDEYSFSTTELPLDQVEVELMRRVDQVFIHSQALLEKKGQFNPHTRYVPNGVAYASFAATHDEPADMKHIPHPRIGYVGHIKTQLDFPLLCELAAQHPEWSLVLVGHKKNLGDIAPFVEQLAAMRNVYFLGHKPADLVCAYPQYMDVCVLPYKINDYTKYIYPIKLHEYLAGGKPIVGTPIRSLLEFAHVIKLASTPSEWSRAVTESLAPDAISIDQIEKRRSIAKQFDWETIVHDIARSMCNRLGPPYREQFSALNLEPFQMCTTD
jgi:glycosyltransferase involved in cell wall biosynthesis